MEVHLSCISISCKTMMNMRLHQKIALVNSNIISYLVMYEVYLPFFQAPGVKVVEEANWGPGWLSLLASVEKKTAIEGGKRKVWNYFRVGSLHSFPFRSESSWKGQLGVGWLSNSSGLALLDKTKDWQVRRRKLPLREREREEQRASSFSMIWVDA